jgi:hypothetical protein
MKHLMIHPVDQIVTLGPLYLHSMFPYERYLAVLKSYMWNHAHPEGSIMEGYTTEEVVACCIDYVKDGEKDRLADTTTLVYYNSSRLLRRTSRNTYPSFTGIT